jgi:hypothetical protein
MPSRKKPGFKGKNSAKCRVKYMSYGRSFAEYFKKGARFFWICLLVKSRVFDQKNPLLKWTKLTKIEGEIAGSPRVITRAKDMSDARIFEGYIKKERGVLKICLLVKSRV